MTDFEIARSQAKIGGRPLMLVFSGSDWCCWCVKLEQEVLSLPEFAAWRDAHVVLYTADFPEHSPQPDELKKQNAELAQRYGVDSFPTVILTDADGGEIARTGYRPGGAAAYAEHLGQLLANWKNLHRQ